ncbi:MAG: hypothetical protein AABX37_04030 [Nanoarchaeota archaeon]
MALVAFLWELVKTWFGLFAAPFLNTEMLWIIVPVYLNWIFADFFQEKRGTSLGNAISNGVVGLWASLDWVRTSIRLYQSTVISGWHLAGNIAGSLGVFAYGLWIVHDGIKGKKIVHYIGRIRVVTYILLMITPLVYNSDMNIGMAVLAMVLFSPLFYFFGEAVEHFLPDPISIWEENKKSASEPEFTPMSRS